MWNAMKTKSLAAALLISSTIHGSLLWKTNEAATEAATEAAAGTTQASLSSRLAGSTTLSPAIRYVTLEPVLIVGRHAPLLPNQVAPQAPMASSATLGQCTNNSAHPVTLNEQKDSTLGLC